MIEPQERLLWLVVGVGVVGAFGLAVPAIGGFAPYALAAVASAVVVDTLLARSPKRVRVLRHCPERLIEGRAASTELHLSSDVDVDVEITDSLPHEPWTTLRAPLRAGVTAVLSTPSTSRRRGTRGLGRFTVRTFGPLGLVRRRHRREGAGDVVNVVIDTARITDTATRLVRGNDAEGARRRRAVERGRELDSLRDYRRGDDIRLVDWKATARRGDLVVKELVPETRQDVVVVLDAGRQFIGGEVSPPTPQALRVGDKPHSGFLFDARLGGTNDQGQPRFDTAVVAGLLVAAAALDRGDRAGLVVLDDDIRAWVPPHEGKATLKRLADATADVVTLPVEPAYQDLAAFLIARLKRRSMICLVTDVVDEAGARGLARALGVLRGRHLVLVIAIGDSALHRFATVGSAAAAHAEAARLLLGHRRRALQALEASAVVVDAMDHQAGAVAVDAWLRLKASGRL